MMSNTAVRRSLFDWTGWRLLLAFFFFADFFADDASVELSGSYLLLARG
jgi:hypothetical protein